MKMKSDGFKKHHFWAVAGAALVLALLAFVMINSKVSDDIAAKQGEIKTAEGTVNVKPPGKGALTEIEKQKGVLESKKDELWKENWENQKVYFTWPKIENGRFAAYENMKFGEPIADFDADKTQRFTRDDGYKFLYEDMAKRVLPTKFAGGWQAVLGERFVHDWGGRIPESRQLWLAMEDVWVQRALLDPIAAVNRAVAHFEEKKPAAGPLSKTFVSPIWQLDLEVVDEGPNKLMKAKLKNVTNQMQLLGNNSTLTLRVWLDPAGLDPNAGVPPVELKIESEFVPGGKYLGELDAPPSQPGTAPYVPRLPSHVLPTGTSVVEIVRVEQVLDERTVPIRQIEKLSLNPVSVKLEPPGFWKDDEGAPAGGAGTPAPAPSPDGPGGRGAPPPSPRGVPAAAPGATVAAIGRSLQQAVNDNRPRYIERTDQLRRMPVAVKLIVDQRYMQDVMVAYANSPLRMQIVQFNWKRFRGNLGPATEGGGSGTLAGGGGEFTPAISADVGSGFDRRGNRDGFPSPRFGPEGAPRPTYIPGLTGGALSSVSDGQANSALIELTIYGIVTLYEKYEPKKDGAAPGADKPKDATPAPTNPMNPAPKPANPGF